MMAEVTWRATDRVESVCELDRVLDRILSEVSPELPQAVFVARRNGDCLTIVLGAQEGSVLSFVAASCDPPYFISLGAPMAQRVFTCYVERDDHTEALASNVVPERDAREAVREFIRLTTGLPGNVTWTEV